MNKMNTTRMYDLAGRMRTYFLTGSLVLAPTVVTIWVLIMGFSLFDGILGRFYDTYVFTPLNIPTPPGLGALSLAAIILFTGMSVRFYTGRKIIEIWDRTINRIPLINRIYLAIRQLANTVRDGSGVMFHSPVLVEFPRAGMYSVGFITRRVDSGMTSLTGLECTSVFVPTTPNPTTGFLIYVPSGELIPMNISIEEAMKLIISGGTVVPDFGYTVKMTSPEYEIKHPPSDGC